MTDPKIGEMILHDYILPPLLASRYRLDVSTSVAINGADKPLENKLAYFDIDAPRFTLAANEVAGVFPPRNGHGPFDEAIPHIALGRRTLPWERLFSASRPSVDGTPLNANGTPIPWMALLIFEDGEYQIETKKKIGDKLPHDIVTRLQAPADTLVDTVTAPRSLIRSLMPCYEELALLTHVRQVNVDDRELGAGDSDGYFAVVMGNRIPSRGKKYRCCLVSIEERTDLVSEFPPPPDTHGQLDGVSVLVDDMQIENVVELLSSPGTRKPFTDVPALSAAGTRGAPSAAVTSAVQISVQNQNRYSAMPSALVQDSLILLTTWAFECEGVASFRALMQALDVGMIGKVGVDGPAITDSGHLRVESMNRLGAPETVFYRGPLVPAPLTRDPNGPYHSADQARRVAPDVGAEDVSYACAFEVGRLLAAADARLAQELMRWRRGAYTRSLRIDSTKFIKNWLHITDLIDDRLPLAALYATKTIGRMALGSGPLVDPFDLVKLKGAPGFDPERVRQTFNLASVDQARALLGMGDTLLGNTVETPPHDLGKLETLDDVLRDTVGLNRLQDIRGRMLDNIKTQLRDFGRIVR